MEKDFLYILSQKLFSGLIQKNKNGRWFSKKVEETIERLYPGRGEIKTRQYYIQKIRLSMLIVLTGSVMAGAVLFMTLLTPELKGNQIPRDGYGGNTREVPVKVSIGEEAQKKMILKIKERMYTEEQLNDLYQEAAHKLETLILGENVSLEHIENDLNLVKELPGYPFQIEWECQNYGVLSTDGKIQDAQLPPEGIMTGLNAIFTYENFRTEYLFYINIFPKSLSEEESEQKSLLDTLAEADAATRTEKMFLLPEQLNGKELKWKTQNDRTWITILFLSFILSIAMYFLKDEDLKKEKDKREEQMKREYPEVVSKLSIYLGAGMSIRKAWEKIAADYEKKGYGRANHYIYDEMKITCQEIKSGISETIAYDKFGKRCGTQLYRKLAALLVQNIRKGSTHLGQLLKEESRIAFEERKNAARKAGEEAGTKLLLPMMMMLCIVMLMILLPAFMTF